MKCEHEEWDVDVAIPLKLPKWIPGQGYESVQISELHTCKRCGYEWWKREWLPAKVQP